MGRSKAARAVLAGMSVLFVLAACQQAEKADYAKVDAAQTHDNDGVAVGHAQADFQVYKSPTCGCCGEWVDHLNDNGFSTVVRHPDNLAQIKEQHGIGAEFQSCHTAVSQQGYVFEGHVPASVMAAFLAEPPEGALGLAVPGMPMGSPGMEMGDRFTPYNVVLLKRDGSSEIYRHIASADDQ